MKRLIVEMRIVLMDVEDDCVTPIKDQKPVGSVTSQSYFYDDRLLEALNVRDMAMGEIIKKAQDFADSMSNPAMDKFVDELSKRG